MKGDVFRPPKWPILFTSIVGTGTHLLLTMILYLLLAVIGFINPANKGSEIVGLLIIWTLLSFVGGYVSARLLKSFNLPKMEWKTSIALTVMLYPAIFYGLFFALDLTLWSVQSTLALPLSSMMLLFFMFIFINAPLSFCGSRFGFTKDVLKIPIQPADLIPSNIPPQPWYLDPLFIIPCVSLVPFLNVFLLFENLMVSALYGQYFYYFGFVFIVFMCTVLIAAEVSIVVCYSQVTFNIYIYTYHGSSNMHHRFVLKIIDGGGPHFSLQLLPVFGLLST